MSSIDTPCPSPTFSAVLNPHSGHSHEGTDSEPEQGQLSNQTLSLSLSNPTENPVFQNEDTPVLNGSMTPVGANYVLDSLLPVGFCYGPEYFFSIDPAFVQTDRPLPNLLRTEGSPTPFDVNEIFHATMRQAMPSNIPMRRWLKSPAKKEPWNMVQKDRVAPGYVVPPTLVPKKHWSLRSLDEFPHGPDEDDRRMEMDDIQSAEELRYLQELRKIEFVDKFWA
jgi:hypothetical protein